MAAPEKDIRTVSDSMSSSVGDKAGLLDYDNGTSSPIGEGAPLHKPDVSRKPHDEPKFTCIKKGEGLKFLIVSCIAFGIAITAALILQIHFGPPQIPLHGGVAADIAQCSTVGVDMLKRGGSAVDAAIATLLCNGVINAQSSGIGGGHFMLVHDHRSMVSRVIDARETAPAAATENMYENKKLDQSKGPLSVAVPGELRGMEKAHQLYGKLAWADLFQPAIDIARKGFPVGKEIAKVLKTRVTVNDLKYSKALAAIYAPDGKILEEGAIIKREDLAVTLEKVAQKGADEFYKGSIADDIIKSMKVSGDSGIMTKADLEKYSATLRPAITSTYEDQTIVVPPLPSGGPTLLMMLNVMDAFNVTASQVGTPTYYQQLLETFKYSFAEYFTMGDSDFNSTLDKRTEAIISKAYAEEIKKKISLTKTSKDPKHYTSMGVGPGTQGTTHISVTDSQELYVSVTSSINTWFGSLVLTEGGVLLNNHMADFSIPTAEGGGNPYNYIKGGKRPQSAMCPSVVHNTRYKCGPRMAFGASNGTRILTGMVEVFMNLYAGGLSLQKSIDLPRIHDQISPMGTWYEKGFPNAILDKLRSMGHTLKIDENGLSAVQAVMKVNETLAAYSDPRKYGKADQF